MIRKAIIVVLTLAAVGMAIAWAASYLKWPGYWRFHSPRLHLTGGHAFYTETYCQWWILHKVHREQELQQAILVNGILHVTVGYLTPRSETPLRTSHEWSSFSFRVDTFWSWNQRDRVTVRLKLPLYAPFFVFAAYPAIAFIRGPVRRYRRRRRGRCLKCGYDLTGNVSGVCPECGKRTPL